MDDLCAFVKYDEFPLLLTFRRTHVQVHRSEKKDRGNYFFDQLGNIHCPLDDSIVARVIPWFRNVWIVRVITRKRACSNYKGPVITIVSITTTVIPLWSLSSNYRTNFQTPLVRRTPTTISFFFPIVFLSFFFFFLLSLIPTVELFKVQSIFPNEREGSPVTRQPSCRSNDIAELSISEMIFNKQGWLSPVNKRFSSSRANSNEDVPPARCDSHATMLILLISYRSRNRGAANGFSGGWEMFVLFWEIVDCSSKKDWFKCKWFFIFLYLSSMLLGTL